MLPIAAALAVAVVAGPPTSDDCLAIYYGIGRARDIPAARRCLEGDVGRVPCGGSSPDIDRAVLAVMYLDAQGGPAEPGRAWELLSGCFEDVTVTGLRERSWDSPTGTFDFCEEIGGTTFTLNDCARLRAAAGDESRKAAIVRLRKLVPPGLHRLLDGAEESWSAFVSSAVAVDGDRYRGGTIATSVMLETDRRLTAERARWLDALAGVRTTDCDGGALFAEDRRLNAAYRRAADGDAEWKALLRKAQRAWIVSRDADAAFAKAWKGAGMEATVRCLSTRARAAAIEADLAPHGR